MTTRTLTEGLGYLDMEGQVFPILGIDQYASTIGSNDDIITLNFTVKQKAVGKDLSSWLEKGYDCVIDAQVSPGEVSKGKYLVFADMPRRTTAPEKIIEMIEDLQTLTDMKVDDWKLRIGDKILPATEENISNLIPLSPHEYRERNESELNEMRHIAGIPLRSTREHDSDMAEIQRAAGIR